MISDLILIAKKFSVPSGYGRRDGVRDFFAQFPDGVYIATDTGAPAGWEGYAVWFGGAGERYAERFMELIRDVYIVERFLRARVGGLLMFTFRCRLKMRRFGTLGKPNGSEPTPPPSPIDDWWGLKLTMPEGGTVTLRKTGNPNSVSLEVSTDAVNWEAWELVGTDYSYTLQAGETLCIRNTSETAVGLNVNMANLYKFVLSGDTIAKGKLISLLIKEESDISLSAMPYCLTSIFNDCSKLLTMPELSGITEYGPSALRSAFLSCTSLEETTILPDAIPEQRALQGIFAYCNKLKVVRTNMTDISSSNFIASWLEGVAATGDFYCPAELTIPTGMNGIPSGWTRHDI